ncbi:hypothetical protein D3C80_919250 [compost metagenome]
MHLVGFDPQVAIAVRLQVGGRFRRVLGGDAAGALAVIRGKGGNVDQARDIFLVAHLGNHRAAIGMTDQQHLAGY